MNRMNEIIEYNLIVRLPHYLVGLVVGLVTFLFGFDWLLIGGLSALYLAIGLTMDFAHEIYHSRKEAANE